MPQKEEKAFNGTELLHKHENHWQTEMGAFFFGERVVLRGKNIFDELNDEPWMGYLLYGITGKLFNRQQIKLFEAIWSLSTSYPEPRVWNNRISTLAGSARSTLNLGIAASVAVSEAKIYGHQVNTETLNFLFYAMRCKKEGLDLEEITISELKRNRKIGGYSRPVVKGDERIEPLMGIAKNLGFNNGEYVKLAFEIQDILINNRYRLKMNVSALTSALAADQGLTKREIYYYRSLMFSAGFVFCYIDAVSHPAGCFFPRRCENISYTGHAKRHWSDL